jgi:VWFA-related protein
MDVFSKPSHQLTRRVLLASAATIFAGACRSASAQNIPGLPRIDPSAPPPQPGQPSSHPAHQADASASSQAGKSSSSDDVNFVNLYATVRDAQGEIVRDLTQDDFVITEAGQPQTITAFSAERDNPLTFGLLVDTSISQRRILAEERMASVHFFERMLRRDTDQAFILRFDYAVELLRNLTSSRKELEAALDLLQPFKQESVEAPGLAPGGGRTAGGAWPINSNGGSSRDRGNRTPGAALYDAVLLAANEVMSKQTGRKVAIVLADGIDNGSRASLERAIASAQRSDTLVYTIRFYDGGAYNGLAGGREGREDGFPGSEKRDGKKTLEAMSRRTGASYFEISKQLATDEVYSRIAEELKNQYSLGYIPSAPPKEGEFRKVELSVKRKDLVVQTREGYFGRA